MLLPKTGVTHHEAGKASPGYTLFGGNFSDEVYLIDLDGEVVHQWKTGLGSTHFNMLLPNGNLWVCERLDDGPSLIAGKGGRMAEYDWDSNLVWDHVDLYQHHDARRLENGHCVYIAWYLLDADEIAQIKGGLAGTEHADGMYGEVIREVDADGKVVWEWYTSELDYDKVHIHNGSSREEYGHANTISPLPNGDYLVSFRVFNMLIIIDRQTGKVKWEFQNDDLGGQHDCQMIDNGNILVFANGNNIRGNAHSAIWEIDPASNEVVWKYEKYQNSLLFFSPHISGCQRLASGNTLICEGGKGCIFEVTPDGDVVWEYVSPFWRKHPASGEINWMFRAKRYAADSPELQNRV